MRCRGRWGSTSKRSAINAVRTTNGIPPYGHRQQLRLEHGRPKSLNSIGRSSCRTRSPSGPASPRAHPNVSPTKGLAVADRPRRPGSRTTGHCRPRPGRRIPRGDETVDATAFDHDADEGWVAGVLEQLHQTLGIQIDRSSVVEGWAGLYPRRPTSTDHRSHRDRHGRGRRLRRPRAHARSRGGAVAAELILDGEFRS